MINTLKVKAHTTFPRAHAWAAKRTLINDGSNAFPLRRTLWTNSKKLR
ncbi:conserved domain protein [delta proteobacterium NaphS2]|nr:conserved domain protein [delta proteobacterium NaphS2]